MTTSPGAGRARRSPASPTELPTFRHEALLYSSPAEFFAAVVPFVEAGVQAGEPVLVLVERSRGDELRRRLAHPAAVEIADMGVVGSNPARIIPFWLDFRDRHGGPTAGGRGVGEPIGPQHTGDRLAECQLHEALLNVAYDDADGWQLLCPYDVSALAPAVVDEARHSHPFVRADGGPTEPSTGYRGPPFADELLARPLPLPPPDAYEVALSDGPLPAIRRLVADEVARLGLRERRATDFELAVGEVAANALRHGGGDGRLRVWVDGGHVIAEVRDGGRFTEPLAGRIRPTVDQIGGRGLWIVQQVCDLVQVRSGDGGTVVRLHMAVAPG